VKPSTREISSVVLLLELRAVLDISLPLYTLVMIALVDMLIKVTMFGPAWLYLSFVCTLLEQYLSGLPTLDLDQALPSGH